MLNDGKVSLKTNNTNHSIQTLNGLFYFIPSFARTLQPHCLHYFKTEIEEFRILKWLDIVCFCLVLELTTKSNLACGLQPHLSLTNAKTVCGNHLGQLYHIVHLDCGDATTPSLFAGSHMETLPHARQALSQD